MMGAIFLDLLIALGCAILFGLICVVFAITWKVVKYISQTSIDAHINKEPEDK